jgi:hypothetical protein
MFNPKIKNMKKKRNLFIIGLMSLVMMSCEDSYDLAEEPGFKPNWFMADEMQEGVLQVIGPEWLAFAEVTKDDWLIAVQPRTVFAGKDSLRIMGEKFPVTEAGIIHVPTNTGEVIPVGFDNLTVTYTYAEQEIELHSWRGLFLRIEIIPDEDQTPPPAEGRQEDFLFYEKGLIRYILCDGTIPLKSVERPFRVFYTKN